jgi:2,4-diaminopentanoate dehydrogenase
MIHVLQVGLGPLGQQISRYLLERDGVRLVGAVDLNPELAGRDIGELCGVEPLGVAVSGSLAAAMASAATAPDVAVIATVSSIERLVPQVEAAARAGLDIVSTCEEMTFPWRRHPAAAAARARVRWSPARTPSRSSPCRR